MLKSYQRLLTHKFLGCQPRCHQGRSMQTMSAWQVKHYNEDVTSALVLNKDVPLPTVLSPDQILVKVEASSVNPLDVVMSKGYGSTLLDALHLANDFAFPKETYDRFPLTLGRDFSGVVVAKGPSVKKIKIGENIWGAVSPSQQGSHAEYVLCCQEHVTKKPENLSHAEAASLPYVFLTTWSALNTFACLDEKTAPGKSVLVMGGTGGIGTTAIQLLKSWGANVSTTCSAEAMEWVKEVTGVDECIDYKSEQLSLYKNVFDVVLDAAGQNNDKERELRERTGRNALKKSFNSKYVTLSSPLLRTIDEKGLALGGLLAAMKAGQDTLIGCSEGISYRWAYFLQNRSALEKLTILVERNQIRPVLEKVYSFNEMPNAYSRLQSGHARGKIVVQAN